MPSRSGYRRFHGHDPSHQPPRSFSLPKTNFLGSKPTFPVKSPLSAATLNLPASRPPGPAIRCAVGCLIAALAALPLASLAETFRAAESFQAVTDSEFAPFYREQSSPQSSEHGVAIDTVRHAGQPAAAEMVFRGETGRFILQLTAVAEEDGESTYHIVVNGRALEQRRNPAVAEKRVRVEHRWGPLALEPGDRIRIVFAGATNGKIPERDGTAWARGRWRALSIAPAAAVQ